MRICSFVYSGRYESELTKPGVENEIHREKLKQLSEDEITTAAM